MTNIIVGTLKGLYHEYILKHKVITHFDSNTKTQKLIDLNTGEILHEFERKRLDNK